MQRAPEDLERVLAGVEAYLTLRKRNAGSALSVFNIQDEGVEQATEQEVCNTVLLSVFLFLLV